MMQKMQNNREKHVDNQQRSKVHKSNTSFAVIFITFLTVALISTFHCYQVEKETKNQIDTQQNTSYLFWFDFIGSLARIWEMNKWILQMCKRWMLNGNLLKGAIRFIIYQLDAMHNVKWILVE